MNIPTFKAFFKSPTARLAGTYLAIIMVLSIGFSLVFYHTSAHELGRQIPPDSFFHKYDDNNNAGGQTNNPATQPGLDSFLQQRATEGRQELMMRLIILNVGALVVGSVISYILARRSLEPIEGAMEAQTQFISDASHELRTPLTAIQTSNEVFLRKTHVSLAEAKEVISRNTDDVKRLKALTDGLLNLAGGQKTTVIFDSVNLQDVVSEAMNQVVAQASLRDVAVHDEVLQQFARADKPSLTQALVILLDNAVKYSNDHGNVTITTHTKGKHIFINVIDEGIGIRASDIPHIFRRFYRADTARTTAPDSGRDGYGLGLAIAHQIITSQAGDISVTSAAGKGSTFSIKLPLAKP